jgi:putative ABC transport system substrate-binding protein
MRKRLDLRTAFSCALLCFAISPVLAHAAQDSTALLSTPAVKGAALTSTTSWQATIAQSGPLLDKRKRDEVPNQGSIAVVYPQIEEPYNSIFTTIARGIESQSKLPVRTYVLVDSNLPDLSNQLRKSGSRGVILLGRKGFQVIDTIDKDLPILVGGVLSVPEDPRYSLISLSPNPGLLFAKMKSFSAQIRRIYVVHNPKQTESQIRIAREAAKEQGLDLVAIEATDVSTAARQYDAVMQAMDGRTDALWLPDDPSTLNNNIVLPRILERSWAKYIPVFSSTAAHVSRGVLFSMRPDNHRMGQTLGISMSTMVQEKGRRYHEPLRDVRLVINNRTARHLDYAIAGQIEAESE